MFGLTTPKKRVVLPPGQLDADGVCARLGIDKALLERAHAAGMFPAPDATVIIDSVWSESDARQIPIWLEHRIDEWAAVVRELGKAIR